MIKVLIAIMVGLAIISWVYGKIGMRKPVDTAENGKKVILIVIDSLLSQPLESLMAQNKVPAFSFLKENGSYINRVISSFPTMSVTIDSTLLTGQYPDQHRVPGLRWYSYEENRLIQYGDGFLSVLKSGIRQVIQDGLFHLNNTHLNKETLTIHEELEASGRSTASINALIYRSNHPKTLAVPWPAAKIQTMAPGYFVLGNFYRYLTSGLYSFINYYGVNNNASIQHLVHLIRRDRLPSFTTVYLADLDHESHRKGGNSEKSILKVDQQLQQVLHAFGEWKPALEQYVFIVMGDSGVCKVLHDKSTAVVDLDQTFHSMKIAPLGRSGPKDEIAIAVNERMSYIYPLQDHVQLKDIIDKLKQDERLDTICWKNKDWIYVLQGGSKKELRYRKGSAFSDKYNQHWDIEGEIEILDLQLDSSTSSITYGAYPDGLMRLFTALHSHDGNFLVVTTGPGYEMKGATSITHEGGGAHGAFHEEDSYFPMFIAGTKEKPRYNRMVDVKDFIIGLLNPTKSN